MTNNLSYAHCICGYGLKDYFINSIESVLFYDPGSKILILNTSHKSDTDLDEYLIKKKNKLRNIELFNFEHIDQKENKTGSLIDGLNYIIDYAYKNNLDYINFLQNDQQMIWWDKRILSYFHEIFLENKNCIQIANSPARLGSHPNIFEDNTFANKEFFSKKFNRKINLLKNNFSALSDTGVIFIKRIKENNIRFQRNETYVGKKYLNLKYELYLTPFPFIFFIPWPKVIREKKVVNHFRFPKIQKSKFIISSKYPKMYEYLKNKNSSSLWHEDLVCSNNFYSLYPSWFSDGWYWYLKIFFKNYKNKKKQNKIYWEGIFDGIYKKRNIIFFLGLRRRYPNFFLYSIYTLFVFIKNKIRNLLNV